ncbi:MAG: zinc transporter ZupT [Spirochaetia bacterium]|nr:zinc transporter ZupT [Spirochaetia bacterium]
METSTLLFALGLTIFAGLSTGIGSIMAFFAKDFNPKYLSATLGFSAGVMIYVSLIEIFVKARESLSASLGDKMGYTYTVAAFFTGIAVIAIIDKLIPSYENPHEIGNINKPNPCEEKAAQNDGKEASAAGGIGQRVRTESETKNLYRMGMFSALAIAIHNFPEGLATFMSAVADPALGISIAVAIAIHNIPEGVAVSIPVYYATKNKKKAFWISLASGLSEPLGAILGFFILRSLFNELAFGLIFASVAGIMVYISLDELLPTAEEYGEHHLAIGGLIAGMLVMAGSLLLLA